ncbi:MAG: hypothetical protein AB7I59_18470 [Geminicoccaceae bacterium]
MTLTVAQNVVINGQTVIAAGAPVVAIVDTAETEGMVGQAGKITISFQTVTAVDGTNVGLMGNFRSVGEDELGGTVAVGVILCPLALLNKGGAATVPAGAQARAITNGEYLIDVPVGSRALAPPASAAYRSDPALVGTVSPPTNARPYSPPPVGAYDPDPYAIDP